MAKLLATRAAWEAADADVQIHGGNGFAEEYTASRLLVDARVLSIFEGANEIQAGVVAALLETDPHLLGAGRLDGRPPDAGARSTPDFRFGESVRQMRSAKDFFKPLAIGAPEPVREIPFKPSRMIHFFDPSNAKMAAKVPDIAKQVDVLLGNLEDAIAADKKLDAREGFIKIAKETDFGDTQLWTRVNSLDSPWLLDDLTRIVTEVGDKVDVIMVPKVEGPWDIHYVDRLLAQLEARAKLKKPDPRARHPRDRARRGQRRGDRQRPARACRACRSARRTSPPRAA